MVPEWFRLIGLVCAGTIVATTTVCLVYGIVRITFLVIMEYKEERRETRCEWQQKHIDQR